MIMIIIIIVIIMVYCRVSNKVRFFIYNISSTISTFYTINRETERSQKYINNL